MEDKIPLTNIEVRNKLDILLDYHEKNVGRIENLRKRNDNLVLACEKLMGVTGNLNGRIALLEKKVFGPIKTKMESEK